MGVIFLHIFIKFLIRGMVKRFQKIMVLKMQYEGNNNICTTKVKCNYVSSISYSFYISIAIIFFRDRAWSHFSLRREEKCYKRVGYRARTDSRQTDILDYTTPVVRPGSLPEYMLKWSLILSIQKWVGSSRVYAEMKFFLMRSCLYKFWRRKISLARVRTKRQKQTNSVTVKI